ncbi:MULTISPECIES: BRO family protein [Vibrio]|uniref:BRO-N domain-containing protein n=1 Tax=Vibrio TaxID=662 RepID=UPI00076A70CF|nr:MULTISPECIES: BRO family protein [Vibrio]NVN81104.1 hypothetical protein [Vibrio sp. Scap16]QLE95110.1 hypothetical protein FLM53_19090 [Vibrio sp. Scap24]
MENFFTLKYKKNYDIRTFRADGHLYTCLRDILKTLSDEDKILNGGKPVKSMATRLQAQIQVLDSDEHKNFNMPHPDTGVEMSEICLTEPGLYRVLTRDETPAGKAFQRWLFHEVLPSIREHKQYPPPENPSTGVATPDFANMDVTQTSLQMLVHVASGLNNALEELKTVKADTKKLRDETQQFQSETSIRLENLETNDQLYGLICMDEFLSKHPDITVNRSNFLSACVNFKLKNSGKHIKVMGNEGTELHYFDIETLSAAKIY